MKPIRHLLFGFALISALQLGLSAPAQAYNFPQFPLPGMPGLPGLPSFPGLPGFPSPQASDTGETFANLPGEWTQGHYQGDLGSRDYSLYVAKSAKSKKRVPLMVMLHGCFQSGNEFARQTGMNDIAEKYGFAVLYPEQSYGDNVWKCWNWFKPENQARDSGEAGIIVGMIKEVGAKISVDNKKIFAAGLSAGAAMASNLGACYSDVVSGIGVHSGLSYMAATSESEAHQVTGGGSSRSARDTAMAAVQCSGKVGKPIAVVAVHGKSDQFVNPINADQVVQQFTKINDLLDDGKENDSQNLGVIASREGQAPNGGYKYTSEFFGGNGEVKIEKLLIEKMKHAWSGAHEAGQYADPKGPDASEAIWLFLSKYGS